MDSQEAAEPATATAGQVSRPGTPVDRAPRWDLVTGIAGLVFLVLDQLNRLTPGTPDPQLPVAEYTRQLAAELGGHQVALWLGFLADAAFMVFLAGLWSRVRRFEGPAGLFATALLVAGTVNVAVLLVSRGCYLALVQYGSTGAPDSATLTTLTWLPSWLGQAQLPAALVESLAIAAAALTTGALPRWLGWLGGLTAVFALLSIGWYIQTATDGVLGTADSVGSWVSVAFFLAISVVLLVRAGERPKEDPAPGRAALA